MFYGNFNVLRYDVKSIYSPKNFLELSNVRMRVFFVCVWKGGLHHLFNNVLKCLFRKYPEGVTIAGVLCGTRVIRPRMVWLMSSGRLWKPDVMGWKKKKGDDWQAQERQCRRKIGLRVFSLEWLFKFFLLKSFELFFFVVLFFFGSMFFLIFKKMEKESTGIWLAIKQC